MRYYYHKWPLLIGIAICSLGILLTIIKFNNSSQKQKATTTNESGNSITYANELLSERQTISKVQPTQNSLVMTHTNIITTVFWVGEPSDESNGFIPNAASAWDEQWQAHYGGVDNSDKRNGFQPANFTPKENPFYFALPYSDITDNGDRKATAKNCPNSSDPSLATYSWCKNAWLAIKSGNKIAYAQWEDVGPFESDDTAYVFGRAGPKNTEGEKAGLDVSPAVRDYLGLGDVSNSDWTFVSLNQVPDGPWKQIITNSPGIRIN